MSNEQAVQKMTDIMAKFVAYTGKVLPDDVREKLASCGRRKPVNWQKPFMMRCLRIRSWQRN